MQIKFLKTIVEHLTTKDASQIVDLLIGKKNVNEFLIAKNLKLTINQTRNILYKLSDYGLVGFIRKRDRRKGWYIYFWTLNVFKSLDLLEEKLKEELKVLEKQLKIRKEGRFYICKTCTLEVNEEAALLNDFKCAECEGIYELADNEEIIKNLEKEIAKLKKEIEYVEKEKHIEGEKITKKNTKLIRTRETQKKTKRAALREAKKKEQKKTERKEQRIKNKAKIKRAIRKKLKKISKKKKIKKSHKKRR
mgnify:CR=1 FL=1